MNNFSQCGKKVFRSEANLKAEDDLKMDEKKNIINKKVKIFRNPAERIW